ncbi:MAG TPA: hypothetical protein VM689_11320 [Aliidongia sp.]|nr:hypothetical protein [Aliidongia sp.]
MLLLNRAFRLFAALTLLGLADCGELPHPFEDTKLEPHAPIITLPDMAVIVVDPVQGAPGDTGAALAETMASALQDADVLASAKPGNPTSTHLIGSADATSVAGGVANLRIRWTMRAADGTEIGTDQQQDTVPAAEWAAGSGTVLDEAVHREAPRLAAMVQVSVGEEHKPTRQVFVRLVEGATGDGDKALPRALVYLLKRGGVTVTADEHAADTVTIAGKVAVTPVDPSQQHVAITWRVLKPDGSEAGQVKQENDIPRGTLDGNWGDVAMAVASSALQEIVHVVNSVPGG